MNIGIFTDTYRPQINGVVTSIDSFAEQLRKKGHTVYIFAPMVPGEKKRNGFVYRFNSVPFPFHKEHRIVFPYSRVLNEFKELELDIIHAQTPFSMGLLAAYLSKKEHIPLIHTYHTLFVEYIHYVKLSPEHFESFVKWASRSYCNQCDLVIAPSEKIDEELKEYGVIPPVEIIPTGIDLSSIHIPVHAQYLREKHGIPDNYHILSFVGRLGKEKNIDFLLQSYQKVVEKKPDTHFFIIGDGPEKKALKKRAEELGIADHVTFTGYVERIEVFAYLAISDIFIFASVTETQGLVVIEAMAAGTPVVAVDAMGVSDVLKGDKGGLLTSKDLSQFTEKVFYLLNNPEIMEEKKIEAKKRAQEWSAENMTEKLLKCYNNIIDLFKKGTKRTYED